MCVLLCLAAMNKAAVNILIGFFRHVCIFLGVNNLKVEVLGCMILVSLFYKKIFLFI